MYKSPREFRPNTKKIYEETYNLLVPDGYAVHHVLPVRLGGNHSADNLVALTIAEHADAHMQLYLEHGDVRDLCAHHMILGWNDEAHALACSMGGKAASIAKKARGQLNGFQEFSPERRREVAAKAGKIGGTKQRDLGIGIHVGKEQRAKWASLGGKVQSEANGWNDPKVQSENGKRGGVKNKGIKQYNDGVNIFGYTLAMQNIEPFDDFIARTNYIKGRVKK